MCRLSKQDFYKVPGTCPKAPFSSPAKKSHEKTSEGKLTTLDTNVLGSLRPSLSPKPDCPLLPHFWAGVSG